MRRAVPVLVAAGVLAAVAAPARAGRATSTAPICSRQDETPTVDLYSFGIGGLTFERFGHSMLCLTYPQTKTICFNYGVTDFSDPVALGWKFMRAEAKFWVAGELLESMLAFYGSETAADFEKLPEGVATRGPCLLGAPSKSTGCKRTEGFSEDRDIWRQRIYDYTLGDEGQPITGEKARRIAAKLCTDTDPDNPNHFYTYHHFKDNCTTRLRDLLDEVFDGKLREDSDKPYPMTFREFGRRGLAPLWPVIAMSDHITGRNLDHNPSEWEAMFHPDILRASVETKLGIEAEQIYVRKGPPYSMEPPNTRPWMTLLAFLLSVPLALARWRGRFERLGYVIAVFPLVFWAVLVWTILFLIKIDWVRWNEALALFLPTDVALFFLKDKWRRLYARVRLAMVVLISLLCAVGVLRQPLWIPILTAFIPLALIAFDLPPRTVRVAAKTKA